MIEKLSLKAYQHKPRTLEHVEIIKIKLLIGLIHHWKGLDLEMVDYEYHQDPTPSAESIPLKPETFKHVEIKKVSDKPTNDTSLESS